MVLLTLAAFGFACRHPIHFLRRLRQPASELIAGRGTNSLIPRRPGGVLGTPENPRRNWTRMHFGCKRDAIEQTTNRGLQRWTRLPAPRLG